MSTRLLTKKGFDVILKLGADMKKHFKLDKALYKTTQKQQEESTILRRFDAVDQYFYDTMILKLINENDRHIFINSKPKRKSEREKFSNFYAYKEHDYSDLNALLGAITIKEEEMKAKGYNLEGVKSFNRNVWLDFSRESNAIEGIIDDFSYDLLSFKVKLHEMIDTDPDKDKPFDKYEYYKKLMHQCEILKERNSKNNGIMIIEGKNKKHFLREETLRHFIAFKYAYKCAKYDRKMMGQAKEEEGDKSFEFVDLILNIHSLIFGRETLFRNIPIYVKSAEWAPPSEDVFLSQLELLSKWVTDGKQSGNLNPIEKAAITHAEFIRIHPFMDGNGRTGRILSNYILIRDEMPTVSIGYKKTKEYFNAIDKAVTTHNIDDLIDIYYEGVKSGAEKIMTNLEHIEKEQKPKKILEKERVN